MHRISRKTQQPDRIYAVIGIEFAPGRVERFEDGVQYMVTPDGEGRYWYEDLHEAFAQHGEELPIYVNTVLEDD